MMFLPQQPLFKGAVFLPELKHGVSTPKNLMKKTHRFSKVNLLILTTVLFSVPFFVGCGENDQPFIETIDNQTIAIDARRTLEIYIIDTDDKDMHTVSATSENSRIATVSVNERDLDSVGAAEVTIAGVAEGSTIITVFATDDSGQDNATFEQVFVVSVIEPELIVSTPSPLKESTLDVSFVRLSLIGLTFRQSIQPYSVDLSGINGVSSNTTRISDTEAKVELSYNYRDFKADRLLKITVTPNALEEEYYGPALIAELPVISDLRADIYYKHIVGPWLWMIAPGGDINVDNLSEASQGVITERQIAQKGVSEGEHFNALKWTKGRLFSTTVCGIFFCSSDNVINVVREIGLTNSSQLSQYSAYALINIYSPREQNDVLMGVGSDDSNKVWLNGSVVNTNDVTRRTTGVQNRFHVDLNRGNNLLLVKIGNHGFWDFRGNNDWGMFFKIYLDPADYTISIPKGE